MKGSGFIRQFVFVFFICSVTTPAASEEMDAGMKEMMAKWMAYATPNENHKILGVMVGEWNHKGKWWMEPNGKTETFEGNNETKWIMGGKFIQHSTHGLFQGQPFEGMGITGYDNMIKKYQTIWLDNMGTGIIQGEGRYDAAKKELTDRGRFTDPVEGSKQYRGVIRFIDDDHYQYEMHTAGADGNEFLAMQIEYTRKK